MINVRTLLHGAWPVAVGGMVGTALRAVIESSAASASAWPWATFTVNVIGSFALGALTGALSASGASRGWRRLLRLGLGTGMIGGFTTYSTFVMEVDARLASGSPALGAAYALCSILLGVAAALCGLALTRGRPRA